MTRILREYHRPAEAAEAAALLQRAGLRTAPLTVGPRVPDAWLAEVEAVVDLGQLGLDFINETADGVIHLGATASLQAVAGSVLLQSLADGIVAEAAGLACGSAMRNAASVGGTLQYARQAAAGAKRDGPPELLVALLALGAEVVLQPAGQDQAAYELGDYLATTRGEGHLLLEVRFARQAASAHGALARVARTPRDQGIVAAAALTDGGNVRVAVAAGGSAPQRLPAAEQTLVGQPLTAERLDAVAREVEAAVTPQSDFRASAEYRRAMAGVLARRALAEAARRAAVSKRP